MQTYYTKWYSPSVGREMEIKVYGHAGRPVLFIPCQDGRFFDFENYRMTDAWAPWIESGQCMVFSMTRWIRRRTPQPTTRTTASAAMKRG